MTAPRAPHRPPDRLPSPRGGHPSSQTASAAARRAGFARLAGARRGLVCSARALTATALLALVGALALPATAEAQADVLVSSLGLDAASSSVSFGFFEFAKGIATGSNTGGYSLTSVELDVATVPGSITNLVVQIWSASGDADPDAAVITLENPTALSVGLNTFSAPANAVLNASTSYFLFVSYTGASPYLGLLRNSTGALDDTGLAGWQDENGFAREGGTTNAWEISPSGQRMRMRFNGTAVGGTPTPSGICDRTQQVHEAIVGVLSGVDDCAAVTVADLAGITDLELISKSIDSLKSGDFAGLTSLISLGLVRNSLTMLPADVFSGLTALGSLSLNDNDLESLPADVFSGLTSLTNIALNNNNLNALPDGLFTGLPALVTLYLHGNPTNPLPLTVTVEKVGTDQVRAKVLTGAPFAVDIPVTLVDGTLAAGATMLRVAAGAVEGTAVTVTRTAGTTAAVTVDVDLSTQPTKPSGSHRGYAFARASSGLPATILPDETPTIPPGLEVTLQLSDDFPLEGSTVTVTATASPASPVAFTVTISATPVAPATAADFTLSTNRVLRFAADATESTGTVRIRTIHDPEPEPTDVVRVSGAVSNAAIEDPDDVTLSIINDDIEDFDFEISAPAAVDEGAGAAVVTVTLTSRENTAPVTSLELYYRGESGETATRGADYTPPPGRDFGAAGVLFATVRPSAFSPNAAGTAWVAEPSFTIGIIDDQEAEVAETIVFAVKLGGDQTPAHTITIRDNDAVASDRPTDLQAAPRSPTVIQLAWTAPSAGSFSITGYRVEASENARGPWSVVAATRNTRPSWGHGGLSAGDTRHYRVSAISPAGTSGPSTVASATTIAAGPAGTNAALPPPQDVNAEPNLPGEIRLSWWRNPDAPSHDLVDRHQYRYRVRDAGAWTVDWTTVNQTQTMPPPGTAETRNYNSVLLQGLTAGTTYEFQVRAVDTADGTSAAVAALGTATGRQMVWIVADVGSVAEGEPLRFTVWRDQRHGPMVAIVRISETGDMLPPDGRSPEGRWHEQVHFGDGNERIPLVLDTVDDGGGTEPDSRVTVEVMPHPLYPDNPDNEDLYDVQPDLGQATITVTAAARGSSAGSVAEPLTAAFEGVPATHDGETAFTFRLAFSEAVAVTPEAMRTRVLTVTGGAVTGAARVAGASGVWAITVTPDSREELSIALAPATECAADGAVCTADGRALSNGAAHIVSGPGPETQTEEEQALTATFEGVPEAHDGERAFRVRVAFSDGISVSYTTVRDASFQVTAGEVTHARRVDGRRDLWEITIEPDADEAVTVRLPETTDCAASGAICTGDGRGLSQALSATIAGPPERNTAATGMPTISGTAQVGEALTASTSDISDADGLDDARFGYQWIRTDTDIQGATGATYTVVDADEGTRLTVRVSFTDDAGHAERLTSAATDAVAAAPEPLTASFEGLPAEHRGQGSFSFRVAFSDGINISYTTVRDASFTVTGGEVTQARRVDRRRDLWKIHGGAGLRRRGDRPAAGDDELRRDRGDLHQRRPAAVACAVGDGGRTGRHRGGRCAGGGRRRRGAGVCGDAEPRGERRADGGLRDGGRQRARG